MENPILNLQCASLEELDKALATPAEQKFPGGHPAVLSLYGPQILVRQFDLPLLSSREINNALKLEVAEVFSLLPEEIEMDYQILDSSKGKTRGVFMGVPKKLFSDYISRFNKIKITVEKITANTFSRINFFLHENKIKNEYFCIIDFFKEGIVNLVVIDKGVCVLLREIHYENLNDVGEEIMYSLKYAVSKSTFKKFDGAYALGDFLNKGDLISNLEKELNTGIKKYNYNTNVQLNNNSPDLFFNINLLKKYIFPLKLQKRLFKATNVILFVSVLLFLITAAKTIKQSTAIKRVSSSYNTDDYKSAKTLQNELDLLKNAK